MEIPNQGAKMTTLTLIKSKPINEQIEEELEEIQLPLFDIEINEEGNWFTKAIEKLEE
jgi:hypothetical protein